MRCLVLFLIFIDLDEAKVGAPNRIRTYGLQLRRLPLYPAELWVQIKPINYTSEKINCQYEIRPRFMKILQ